VQCCGSGTNGSSAAAHAACTRSSVLIHQSETKLHAIFYVNVKGKLRKVKRQTDHMESEVLKHR
jgi:hypothetical protein